MTAPNGFDYASRPALMKALEANERHLEGVSRLLSALLSDMEASEVQVTVERMRAAPIGRLRIKRDSDVVRAWLVPEAGAEETECKA
jgi:hypothetical protein